MSIINKGGYQLPKSFFISESQACRRIVVHLGGLVDSKRIASDSAVTIPFSQCCSQATDGVYN